MNMLVLMIGAATNIIVGIIMSDKTIAAAGYVLMWIALSVMFRDKSK